MRGVDRMDQLLAAYSVAQKLRWWLKIFYYFIDCSIINSYRLIESYFRNCNGLKVNGSWIYSVQNCLEEFIAEFPNVIVDGKPSKIT
jgi:hypothetical protein